MNGSRLQYRPQGSATEFDTGTAPLGVGGSRDGVLYVPDTAVRGAPPLVFLHGATGSGEKHLRAVLAAADQHGVVVIAPDSQTATTWDVIASGFGAFGPDVEYLDAVLAAVDRRIDVDWSRLCLGGVSDGASYALCLGVTNGDVFPNLIAFSPGFVIGGELVGRPRIYVSHGTADPILPIDTTSRAFVPRLQEAGYDVTFEEFDGGHTVPPPVSDRALRWWLRSPDAVVRTSTTL